MNKFIFSSDGGFTFREEEHKESYLADYMVYVWVSLAGVLIYAIVGSIAVLIYKYFFSESWPQVAKYMYLLA